MRIVFFGTPSIASDCLEYLYQKNCEIVAVVSKPDKAQGRSKKLVPTPVKQKAQELSLPIYQPEKASSEEFAYFLETLKADLFVVVAYGEIIKQTLLDMPSLGCINLHASLLPKYRGAAPIQRAIMNGDKESGVTVMHMVKKMDAGDIIEKAVVPISENMTHGDLLQELALVGKKLLHQVVVDFSNGIIKREVQDLNQVTFANKIEQEDCLIDWNKSAFEIHNLVRGTSPKPAAFCYVMFKGEKKRLKILKTRIMDMQQEHQKAHQFISFDKKGIILSCVKGSLFIEELHLEGKKVMSSSAFALGINPEEIQFL